ncbi:MAG: carbon-nitrogen hydrolase family protein [Acidimicrobiales bacterium]
MVGSRCSGVLPRFVVPIAVLASLVLPTASADPSQAAAASPCARLSAPTVVPGRGDDHVVAMQYFEDPAQMTSYGSIRRYVGCWFSHYARSGAHAGGPTIVVFNELTALSFGLEGSRGAAARAFATTPAAALAGQETGQPLGALGGALGLVAANYGRPVAFYAAKYPAAMAAAAASSVEVNVHGGTQVPAAFAFLSLTDTYVRSLLGTFSNLARTYHVTVVVGAVLPVLTSPGACAANGYPGWAACPGWELTTDPVAVAALADPDLATRYASGAVHGVYEAVTPTVSNAAFLFAPDGSLYGVQPKVNLTSIELELGWTPAPPSTVTTYAQYKGSPGGAVVPGVRIGIAISLDAFEHGDAADPCSDPGSYMACLATRGTTLLLQPEFNDGTPQCASWSTFSSSCSTPPSWQQLGWMLSSWYDVQANGPAGDQLYGGIRYAVNSFMVGNLYDLTGDGQSAIVARADTRAVAANYVGDSNASLYAQPSALAPYGDPISTDDGSSSLDPLSFAQLEGPQPGFLGLAPWVLPDTVLARDDPSLAAGDAGSLQSCTEGLVGGSGVRSGPCAQNAYRATAVVADLRF